MAEWSLYEDDCLEVMRTLQDLLGENAKGAEGGNGL